jgi:hypothetical protein
LRFSYLAIIAGLKILDEIEQNERPFNDSESNLSSESESDNDENSFHHKNYPKTCGRQDNIMPSGRLSETLEDINCELMKRADSNASSYQPSPSTVHRLISSEDLNHYPRSPPPITP